MDIWETFMWFSIAIVQYAILSTIYKENWFYNAVEGLCLGAICGFTIFDNLLIINNNIIRPIQTAYANNWWLIFSIILGGLFMTLYVRRLINVFRLVQTITLTLLLALIVRTNSGAVWAQVTASSTIYDFSYFALWLTFIFGSIYFVYSRKLEKITAIPREIGRWVIVFELGALLMPMYLRYCDGAIGWTVKLNNSPAWWVPFVAGAAVLIHAIATKYGLIGRRVVAVPSSEAQK
ncbi:MAG: hypothetical protein QG670_2637 [Thermoproteota archaeon]|nr:hypothetical protein [Thermoproteota archaeon]